MIVIVRERRSIRFIRLLFSTRGWSKELVVSFFRWILSIHHLCCLTCDTKNVSFYCSHFLRCEFWKKSKVGLVQSRSRIEVRDVEFQRRNRNRGLRFGVTEAGTSVCPISRFIFTIITLELRTLGDCLFRTCRPRNHAPVFSFLLSLFRDKPFL